MAENLKVHVGMERCGNGIKVVFLKAVDEVYS